MSRPSIPSRPLAGLKYALRQCRKERQVRRWYSTPPSAGAGASFEAGQHVAPEFGWSHRSPEALGDMPPHPRETHEIERPRAGFRPSQAIKQNRFDDPSHKKIRVLPAPPSHAKLCPDPISKISEAQLRLLDPTGARTRLFSDANPERAQPGDILLVRLKSGDPFAGVCIEVRKRNSPIDTAILLRNHLTRIGVEMWYKVYSPNVEGIEIVQRKEKRARRAKLTYMRKPKHDRGSVENIVAAYQRQRAGITSTAKKSNRSRDFFLPKKQKKSKA